MYWRVGTDVGRHRGCLEMRLYIIQILICAEYCGMGTKAFPCL